MNIAQIVSALLAPPLLVLALGSMALVTLGGSVRRRLPMLSGLFRGVGNLGLFAALLLTALQVTRLSPGLNLSLPQLGMPDQVVAGKETRVQLGRDGHFWVRAKVNGTERRFLVDTGASLTALSPETADAAAVEVARMRQPVILNTANGPTEAQLATIRELRFGNVVARDLDAVIAPGMGDTNVLGMNFLSRLASWRVEGKTLILVPNHPQSKAQS